MEATVKNLKGKIGGDFLAITWNFFFCQCISISRSLWNVLCFYLFLTVPLSMSVSLFVQSNLCTTASLGTQKNWPLFKSGRYPGADREKLTYALAGCGLGGSLLTVGLCLEVAVNTGLTVCFSVSLFLSPSLLLSFFSIHVSNNVLQVFWVWLARGTSVEGEGNSDFPQNYWGEGSVDCEQNKKVHPYPLAPSPSGLSRTQVSGFRDLA
jgi:hypothetical protein